MIIFSLSSLLFLFGCFRAIFTNEYDRNLKYPFDPPPSGRWVTPTVGEVWPKPQVQTSTERVLILRPTSFQFKITGQSCDIIDEALRRYYDIIFYPGNSGKVNKNQPISTKNVENRAFLDIVDINLSQPCETLPSTNMDERYDIKIDSADNPLQGLISSSSVWGILRGLETFSQLVYTSADGVAYQINSTVINDFPRFGHRGVMLDTARHYLPLKTIKKNLDLMAHNKFNVFHWHIVDDQSFPYESAQFPNISRYGSFNPYNHIYTAADIRDIVEYARLRGIRVIPEFDTPGHTQAWGPGVPGLLTECYESDGTLRNDFGPINPIKDENYVFLQELFKELFHLFPEPYIHMGGDEVEYFCWQNHPEILQFMNQQGWGNNFGRLQQYYLERLFNATQEITGNQIRFVVWQEVIDNNFNGNTIRNDTIIHIWKSDVDYHKELQSVTALGYQAILSSPWYLNYISYGIDWDKYYIVEPLDFNGTQAQKQLVIGGELCMWAEFVDSVSVIPRTWPRASSVAERLWSSQNVNDPRAAAPRLEEHRCRLLRRGFNIDPVNGVGFCEEEWDN